MIEDNPALGGNDEGDLIHGVRQSYCEIALVMQAAETNPFVPAVNSTNDDIGSLGRKAGVTVAKHL